MNSQYELHQETKIEVSSVNLYISSFKNHDRLDNIPHQPVCAQLCGLNVWNPFIVLVDFFSK